VTSNSSHFRPRRGILTTRGAAAESAARIKRRSAITRPLLGEQAVDLDFMIQETSDGNVVAKYQVRRAILELDLNHDARTNGR